MTDVILSAVEAREAWVAPVAFILAFGESPALVSLVVPATALLVALGGLIGAVHFPLWPAVTAATLGALLGDWVSYVLGYYFKDSAAGAVLQRPTIQRSSFGPCRVSLKPVAPVSGHTARRAKARCLENRQAGRRTPIIAKREIMMAETQSHFD